MRTSRIDPEQEIRDEATAIRLAADIASKRAAVRISQTSVPTSSSRQRIRELLAKQRLDEEPAESSTASSVKAKDPFQPNLGKMLWVYR